MKKIMEGSEFPDLDRQASSTEHIDRYKSQKIKNSEKTQNKEENKTNGS